MTQIELYKTIKQICPIQEVNNIIDCCEQQNYNKARLIIDSLQDDERYKLDQQFYQDDISDFNNILKKIEDYQIIWNELVYNLEVQYND